MTNNHCPEKNIVMALVRSLRFCATSRFVLFFFLLVSGGQAQAADFTGKNDMDEHVDALIEVPGIERGLSLARTHDVAGNTSSWFGAGWITDLQNRLYVLPGGDVLFHEGGAEKARPYRHVEGAAARTERAMRESVIVARIWRRDGHHTDKHEQIKIRKLASDEQARHRLAENMQLRGAVKAGATLKGEQCTGDRLRAVGGVASAAGGGRNEAGFERESCRGDREGFDAQGRLIWREPRAGYRYMLDYPGTDRNALPAEIRDVLGNRLRLRWTKEGLLASASVEQPGGKFDGREARYRYEDGRLIDAEDVAGRRYRYRYDASGHLVETIQGAAAANLPAGEAEAAAPASHIERDPVSGKIVRFVDARGDFRYRHDANGRLVSAAREGSTSIQLTYTAGGQIERMLLLAPDGKLIDSLLYIYDARGLSTKMVLEGKGEVVVQRDDAGKITDMQSDLNEQERLTVFGMGGRLQMLKLPADQAERLGH